jgi:outer membrane protein OmpA-like peptidoglycan-associated protein
MTRETPASVIVVIAAGLLAGACGGAPAPSEAPRPTSSPAPAAGSASAAPSGAPTATAPAAAAATATPAGFDISRAPIVTPQLGKFPYVTLIDGYKRGPGKNAAFDKYEMFDGSKIFAVEGRLSTIEAEGKGATPHEVLQTYQSLASDLGGVTVFQGKGEAMLDASLEFSDARHRHPLYATDQMGVYVVRLPDREIWIEAYTKENFGQEEFYSLTVVETKPLEVKASLLPADAMKKELDARGRVALYINFDFNQTTIRPESRPMIDEIVKLLANSPDLDLTVEGHTDNVGDAAYNKKLSEGRARAVAEALTAKGVDGRRLEAVGHGSEKPLADNASEDGRAKNRRVELVKVAATSRGRS